MFCPAGVLAWSRNVAARRWHFAVIALLLLGNGVAHSAAPGHNEKQAQRFFESTNLTLFQVELDEVAVGQLESRPKTYVSGRVRVAGEVLEEVGIRLKGSGTFQPIYEHPSLTLKFNWRKPHQRFSGLTKLFLENSGQDASRLCKLVANGAFADGGIAAPRITQARVQLNGRELGACVVAEAIDKDFLKHHFGNADGNMYEAFFRDISSGLKQDNGERGDQSDLRELCAAATRRDLAALGRFLNTEQFLNFLAIEMILANWDGYAFHQNNYRVYHDPSSGRMSFVPHDLDNTFSESGMSLMPPRNGILTAALVQSPEQRKDFRERIARLLPVVLDPERIQRRVRDSKARLSQLPEADTSVLERQAALMDRRVRERWQHIKDELAGVHPATPAFDESGVARLTNWSAKSDWNNAAVKSLGEDEKPTLCIETAGGYCFGSWRLPVWLAAGRYRLEGQAKTRGVAGLPSQTGSGAGVRVLGGRRGGGLQDSSGWAPVRFTFTVQEDWEWVELIAELRAFSGTAWFDPETLKLVRVK